MGGKKYSINGRVIDKDTGQGFEGLIVEAYDKDIISPDDKIESSKTDMDGRFNMVFDDSKFKDLPFDRKPDLYFHVLLNEVLLECTGNNALWNLSPGRHEITISIEGRINQICGNVLQSDGFPAPGINIRLFNRGIRNKEQLIDNCLTEEDGRYNFIFSDNSLKLRENDRPNLAIKAFRSNEEEELPIATQRNFLESDEMTSEGVRPAINSPVIYNARRVEKVDIYLDQGVFTGPSEFERLVESLQPLLNGIEINELQENEDHQDITYLVEKTGENPDYIQFLVVAGKYAKRVKAFVGNKIAWNQVFYGLMRNGLPVNLHSLLSQNEATLKASLKSSLTRNLISQNLTRQADKIVEKFPEIFSRLLSEPSQDDEPNPFYDMFKAAGLDEKQRQAISDTYVKYNNFGSDFWDDLGKQPVFKDTEIIEKASLAIEYGTLTGFNAPLIQKLFDRNETSAAQLARFDTEAWRNLLADEDIPDDAPGEDINLKRENYARALTGLIEDSFPSRAFAARLENNTTGDAFDHREKADLLTFFKNDANTDFEIHRHAVDLYLEVNAEDKLEGIGNDRIPLVRRRLKQIQRVFKLLPDHREIGTLLAQTEIAENENGLKSRFDCVSSLLKDGLDSAYKISRLGRNDFVNRTAPALGGTKRAAIIHERARKLAAMAQTIYTRFEPAFHQVEPKFIKSEMKSSNSNGNNNGTTDSSDADPLPATWRSLFGSADFCECKHCRSVLSPSAYLVDILNFLADRRTTGGENAKEVLFKRRPDIGQIELTCKNTSTKLPYIDLVNEVLETVVLSFDIDASLAPVSDNPTVTEPLLAAFGEHDVQLDPEASIETRSKDQQWIIMDGPTHYFMTRHNEEVLRVSPQPAIGLQTRGTAPELEANPENVNPAAYLPPLQDAVFPWNLPADVWISEARAYLEHLGIQRHELMTIFFNGPKEVALADQAIVGEFLGLSSAERQIISSPREPWTLWGIEEYGNDIRDPADPFAPNATGSWVEVLSRISIFQKQSDLKYREIQELLDTYFINPVDNDGNRVLDITPQLSENRSDSADSSENGSDSTDSAELDFCNLSRLQITGQAAEVALALTKIPRFVRLWRKIGWGMRDIDRAINALQPDFFGCFTPAFLVQLSHIQRLRTELNIPIPTILSWWADIDTARYTDREADGLPDLPSLYEQLFQNRSVDNPLNEAFTLNLLRDELQSYESQNPSAIRTYQGEIAAALEISAEDFSLIFDRWASEFNEFVIDSSLINDLDSQNQSEALLNTFRDQNFTLTPEISIAVVTVGQQWHIRDRFGLYTIVNQNGTLSVVSREREDSPLNLFDIDSELINDLNGQNQSEALLNAFRDQNFTLTPEISIEVVAADQQWHIRDRFGLYTVVNQNGTLSVVSHERTSPLNLANLSVLYRYASLAKALELSARNLGSALDNFGVDPFAGTLQTLLFVEKVVLFRSSVFSIEELDYLLRHQFLLAADFAPSEDEIGRLFNEILIGLQQIRSETEIQPDPSGELTRSLLARVVPSEYLEQAVAIVNGRAIQEETDSQEEPAQVPESDQRLIDDHLAIFLSDPEGAKIYLADDPAPESLSARYDYILRDLLPYLRRTMSENLLIERLAGLFGMETAVVSVLLSEVLNSRDDANISAMQGLMALNNLGTRGLIGSYYQTVDWTGEAIERVDTEINFDWATSDPIGGVTGGGSFSVRWSGKIIPRYDEIYTFYARTDDGVRLTVDNQIVIDNLQDQSVRESPGEIELKSGRFYDITIEYYNRIADAVAELRWSSPSTPKEIVPRDRLFQDDGPVVLLNLFHKVALVVNRLQIQPDELRYIDAQKADFDTFDFNDLPLIQQTSPSPDFSALVKIIQFFNLKSTFISDPPGLFEFIQQLSDNPPIEKEGLFNQLHEQNRWALLDLQTLLGTENGGHLGLTFPGDYRNPEALTRLLRCFQTLRKLGATATQAIAWTGDTVDFGQVNSLKKVVKAKYDEEGWRNVARPVSDRIRELRRDALSAYIINRDALRDKNELYAHYLIDVEMSACQMTSRMVQALSSCQLFVMRCLMNLEEPEVVADANADNKWRRWEWMQRYRVWEANRKVFLYPENWIYPELRDDKTPFFQELETELLQGEVTKETAETAFHHYLDKLQDVARLEVMGMYHEEETEDGIPTVDILHVFARTYSKPHSYYYRKRINSDYWTAWERVDLDIQGDYLLPVIWNRRLYIFWPIFTEKQEERNVVMPTAGGELASGNPYLEVQIAWSEFKEEEEWTPQRTTESFIEVNRSDKSAFVFEGEEIEGDLWIDVITIMPISNDSENVFLGLQGRFHFVGCDNKVNVIEVQDNYWSAISYLQNTTIESMVYIENSVLSNDTLYLRKAATWEQNIVLRTTPGVFNIKELDLLFFRSSNTKAPVFYSDHYRTYFIKQGEEKPKCRSKDWQYQLFHYYSPTGSILSKNIFENMLYDYSFSRYLNQTERNNRQKSDIVSDRYSNILVNEVKGTKIPYCKSSTSIAYIFENFYHPFICTFIRELNRNLIDGLLKRDLQRFPHLFSYPPQAQEFNFDDTYDPVSVAEQYPVENVDFSENGAYAQYNWELFFHVPLLIADHLSKNQKYQEARKWLNYIFDPTDVSSEEAPQRYWQMAYFFETTNETVQDEEIRNLIRDYAKGEADPEMITLVERWADNPFNPHLVARLRRTAYQRHVVMRYIDDLIAEGDQLFRRETLEDINEATQLYILAANILGRKPEIIPRRAEPQIQTFNSIESILDQDNDAFSNPLVEIEPFVTAAGSETMGQADNDGTEQLPPFLYFCIPHNDKLLGYWDTVADRLFKIRHCMNIEGEVIELPLFQPPIDPGLLVRAAAAGIDISSALNNLNAAIPHYRFNIMASKATELCSDLKALSGALLSTLEKKDAEELALLRSSHELNLLNAIKQTREDQVEEARESIASLNRSRELSTIQAEYYDNLERSNWEDAQGTLLMNSLFLQSQQEDALASAAIMQLLPDLKIGSPTTFGYTVGGTTFARFQEMRASLKGLQASEESLKASMLALEGGIQRNLDRWEHEVNAANKNTEQIDRQIAAANIRLAIAENELSNHEQQIDNANEVDDFLRGNYSDKGKFTNKDLYNWMVGQISGVYFQSYQLAYDVAKRAEMAFRFELGLQESNYIQFGYWDSLKKGLLAGDRLFHDLKRMELAYLDQNKREIEITKHISLAIFDPVALIRLKETGTCFVHLPEVLFDIDCPGHYMRRIKSVNLTIPAVTGPYTNVSCTLTLLKSTLRRNSALSEASNGNEGYERTANQEDSRFSDTYGIADSIVTSSAQNDSGMFEFNLRDERYLPFEGYGVISDWRIELPKEFKSFDYGTITDVILHIRYTARDGGSQLKGSAERSLISRFQNIRIANNESGLTRLYSSKQDFSADWHRFLNPASDDAEQVLEIEVDKNAFPNFLSGATLQVTNLEVVLLLKNTDVYDVPTADPSTPPRDFLSLTVEHFSKAQATEADSVEQFQGEFTKNTMLGNQPSFPVSMEFSVIDIPRVIRVVINSEDMTNVPEGLVVTSDNQRRLDRDQVDDVLFILSYNIAEEDDS